MVRDVIGKYSEQLTDWRRIGYVEESIVNKAFTGDPEGEMSHLEHMAMLAFGFTYELPKETEINTSEGIKRRIIPAAWRYSNGHSQPTSLTESVLVELPTCGFLPESELKIRLERSYHSALSRLKISRAPDFDDIYPLIIDAMEKIGWEKRTIDGKIEYKRTP